MISIDAAATAALEQSGGRSFSVQAFYGAKQTLADVPLTFDGSLQFTATGQIQASGTVSLARDGGDSLVPQAKTDQLAPYGQELSINYVVAFGGDSWTIPLGRFRIKAVPKAKNYFRRWPDQAKVVGWAAQLSLVDRFDIIDAADFLAVTAPVAGNSTWDEIQRLSPIPIVKNLDDQALPAGMVYQSRSDAITQLFTNLGADPSLTRQGALTGRIKNPWLTETNPVFTINGTIDLQDGMSNELYNSVAVTNPNNATILAVAQITDQSNPLCITGPLGERTYTNANPLMDTQAKAQSAAQTILARVSTQQSRTVQVTCLPRPDIELGDFGEVVDELSGVTVLGSVDSMTFSMDPSAAMTLNLIVAETR